MGQIGSTMVRAVFLISLYGAPLAPQRATYLGLHSSLFAPVTQLIMIILSLGSSCTLAVTFVTGSEI